MTISSSLKLLNYENSIKPNYNKYSSNYYYYKNQSINETSKWIPNIVWRGQGGKNVVAL
ncbi:hypothetical protein RB653_006391 [Dictyostelium firmibasis]|uniref:Uncharacterized protein n=1 Tax=Dictyostelium firmibasis TaxID=79012 RepID=A0AAN7U2N7_9MYCE